MCLTGWKFLNNFLVMMQRFVCNYFNVNDVYYTIFDVIGVLKKSKEAILEKINNTTVFQVLFSISKVSYTLSSVCHCSVMEVNDHIMINIVLITFLAI